MYSVCFTIAGVIFSILLFVLYSFKTKFNSSENKIYYGIIIATVVSCLIEVYSFLLVKNDVLVTSSLYLFTLKLLFLSFLAWLYLFTLYTVVVTLKLKDKDDDKYRMILITSSIVFGIFLFVTLLLPITITKTKGMLLPSGIGVDMIYLSAIVCFVIMIISILSNKDKLKNKKYYPMYFLIVILGLVILVQKIFPDMLLINFSLSILIYVMYFTIENPNIKLRKELAYTKELLEKRKEESSNIIDNLSINIKKPLMEIANFSNKKLNKKDINLKEEDLSNLKDLTLSLVDEVNKIMDINRIQSSAYKIRNKKYEVNNLVEHIEDLFKIKNVNVKYEIDELPKILYGDDNNIILIVSYLIDFINKYFENCNLVVKISKLIVRSKCKLRFSIEVNSKYNNIEIKEKNNKCEMITKAIDYDIYEKLIKLQNGNNYIKKNSDKFVFEFVLYQNIETENKVISDEVIDYFDGSGKNVLIALNNSSDIKKLTNMLMGYNVDITSSSSINEVIEILNSNKTFDLVFLSDTTYGIENENIGNEENFKRTINKFSLIAGYKLQVVMVSLDEYQDENIEYLKLPISKVKLDDILIKYLSEE